MAQGSLANSEDLVDLQQGMDASGSITLSIAREDLSDLASRSNLSIRGIRLPSIRWAALDLDLRRIHVLRPGAVVSVDGTAQRFEDSLDASNSLWTGKVRGLDQSDVFLGISEFGIRGWIATADERFEIVATSDAPAPGSGVPTALILPSTMVAAPSGAIPSCGSTWALLSSGAASATPPMPAISHMTAPQASSTSVPSMANFWTVSLAVETDVQFYNKFNSVPSALAYVTQLIGAVATRFSEQVNVQLQLAYVGIHTAEQDGWFAQDIPTNGTLDLLSEFQAKWKNGAAPVAADLYHFISGWWPGPSSPSGIGWFSDFCAPLQNNHMNFAISTGLPNPPGSFPIASNGLSFPFLLVAHEIGHNFRAIHTHDYCPPIDQCAESWAFGPCQTQQVCTSQGSIMSYCWSCTGAATNLGTYYFHPQSVSDMRAYLATSCAVPPTGATVPVGPLAVFPMAARPLDDALLIAYPDLDPGPGTKDFDCGGATWDGVRGIVFGISGLDKEQIGVPVFAVADGFVIKTKDGVPGLPACTTPTYDSNFIEIVHGQGLSASYRSLKPGSLLVAEGDHVRAGQQIGLVGSSECNWPKCYVEFRGPGGMFDPHSGACQAPTFTWKSPIPKDTTQRLHRFYFSRENPPSTFPPNATPTTGQFATTDTLLWYVTQISYLPPGSTLRHRIFRPNGSVYGDWTATFGNTTPIWWSPWYYWTWTNPGGFFPVGTWSIKLDLNGVNVLTAPFEVVSSINPSLNRPPKPIAVQLVPSAPTVNDPITCVVTSSLVADDLDYDLVRYRYRWKVGSKIVRDVVSAARSDVIPHHTALDGESIVCEVTPNDGKVDGPMAAAAAAIAPIPNSVAYDSASSPNSRVISTLGTVSIGAGGALALSGGVPYQPAVLGYSSNAPSSVPVSLILPGNPGSFVLDLASAVFLEHPSWMFDPAGRALVVLPRSPNSALIGQQFLLQWLGLDIAGTQVILSHGIRITIAP